MDLFQSINSTMYMTEQSEGVYYVLCCVFPASGFLMLDFKRLVSSCGFSCGIFIKNYSFEFLMFKHTYFLKNM